MPQDLRVGDRERAAAAERLSAHHAAGRLSVDELEQRLERANAAVYAHELDALEADLPQPRPRRAPAPPRIWPALPFALIALGVAGSIAVGHPLVPLFLVAAFLLWRRAACA
jgi:fatty acid desaturase